MRRRLITPRLAALPVTRIAWWAAFLTTLALILVLSFVRSAKAAAPTPIGPVNLPGVVDLGEEDESEEGEESEDEAEEAEVEACEAVEDEDEEEECLEELGFEPPLECLLSDADAAVSADLGHGKLRLAVRYDAYEPATVAVDYRLKGSKGPLSLEGDQKHFGRSGIFRLGQDLTAAQAKKVAAAKSFTVTIRPVNAPHSCASYLDQHLTERRTLGGGPVWVDAESTFRHARHHRPV
jgi:hypothetical protein